MKMKKKIIISTLLLALVSTGEAQTTREEMMSDLNKTGGVYYAYPVSETKCTPHPDGYKPVYISHYGRHGSRYLISTEDYTWLQKLLQKAKEERALTPKGEDVLVRIDSVMIEAAGRGGDLSPLGVRQHRGIAERMHQNYPEVFEDSIDISARSTLVVRCVLSMDAFCERLKELNHTLQITRESSQRYMPYLCYSSPESDEWKKEWREEYRKFKQKNTHPDRLVNSIFNDNEFIRKHVNPVDFMWGMYFLASDMQDMETELSFYDLFEPEELFDLWQVFNFDFYAGHANYAGNQGLMIANAGNLLRNIIESADEALVKEKPSVTLRFGHDGNLIPLAGILDFPAATGSTGNPDEAYKFFADYKVAPMAGNIQIVFFRNLENPSAPMLVKLMLNEEEQQIPVETNQWPYYNWEDVREYYVKKI